MSIRLGGAAEVLGHACGSLGLRVRKISVTSGLEMGTGDDFRGRGRARAYGPAPGFGLERDGVYSGAQSSVWEPLAQAGWERWRLMVASRRMFWKRRHLSRTLWRWYRASRESKGTQEKKEANEQKFTWFHLAKWEEKQKLWECIQVV